MKRFIILITFSIFFWSCKKNDNTKFPSPPIAEAGTDQQISPPENSLSLSGSGSTSNGYIKGYLWSLISGPNLPTIQYPSSKNTTVSNLIIGTYIFQFIVIDNAGLSDADTIKITVSPSTIKTITFQPSENTEERHLFGNGAIDQSTYATEIVAATWTYEGDVVYARGLLKFDLSSLPSNATIVSAYLSLFSNPNPLNGNQIDANSGSDNSLFIRRVTSPWSGSATFWNNQPSSTTTDQVLIPHTNSKMLDLLNIDVKKLITAMRASGNYGFLIRLQNETLYNMRNFCSSRNINSLKRPKLVINYQ